MIEALERQEASEEAGDDGEDQLAPLQKSKTVPTASSENADADGLGLGIDKVCTGTTLVEPNTGASPESTPSMSSEDASEVASPSPITPRRNRHGNLTSTGKARSGGSFSTESDLKASALSSILSRDAGSDNPQKATRSRRLMSSGGESTTTTQEKPQNVGEVVAEAMKTLSLIRQKEQAARPLRIVRQDPHHTPDEALKKRFQDLVDDELKIRRLNAKDWLRVATWWLLKVRTILSFVGPKSI